ncbi:threonine synthase [Candidatus Xianfuyuplasma coldseepsis]|uniref:Threonine synthase n=1 Tax=Candidatus Xianfuyuplasma coldseepsis TaxID=2782163 RepID=A0A7L7KQZ5_9MOLU|nr:threonine synthase [Xianfuyuplasma coldseepsis]QMS84374.1 threonine synthase [Xianfuyuplasma coldseepsis]
MMVKSTRSDERVTPSMAILNGLAKDGGLYVFESIPKIDIKQLTNASYTDVAKVVFGLLLDDFSQERLNDIIDQTYNSNLFHPAPITMTHHKNHSYLNLYHGETLAFKDMALSILPKLIQEAKQINGIDKPSIVLTATSGDTGSAALAGFQQNKDDYVFVLYPTQGVSSFQEKQMNQLQNDQCTVYAIDGNFDDCQTIVKTLFQSITLTNTTLVSANSINIGRLVPQITYYVYAYTKLVQDHVIPQLEPIDVVVPTGNFGNIYAAYIAKQMGVPFDTLTIASNTNNVLHDFFQTGSYTIKRPLYKTISPSMDIIISSNLERYLYTLFNHDASALQQAMTTLQSTGELHIDVVKHQTTFDSGMATEQETLQTIKDTFLNQGTVIDPHTAVGTYVYHHTPHNHHTIIVATASPFKFIDAMEDALDIEPSGDLQSRLQRFAGHVHIPFPARINHIASYTLEQKQILTKDEAMTIIRQKVGIIDEN